MIPISKAFLALLLAASVTSFAGELIPSKKEVAPPEPDPWKFTLAVPGWMAGVEGTVGVNGKNSNIDLGFHDILPHIDMIWATSAEVSKGRFGVLVELIYLSMSDGIGSDGPVQKLDVRVDEYLTDFTLRYRLLEGPRGFVDLLAGVRYTNIFQHVSITGNSGVIEQTAANAVDDIANRIRERIEQRLSEDGFRGLLRALIESDLTNKLSKITGRDGRTRDLPMAPLLARGQERLGPVIEALIRHKEQELIASTRATVQAAEAAERAAAQEKAAAVRAQLQAKAAALRTQISQRIDDAKAELTKKIASKLDKALNQTVNRDDAWLDPYVGLRVRYNFTHAVYVIARGDIGGFGIGSELMWQAEGALGAPADPLALSGGGIPCAQLRLQSARFFG